MNRRPELLQTLLDLITLSMKKYTSKTEDNENITYSINRRFAEIYIGETADIKLEYDYYQLTLERLNIISSLQNLWETQKEVVKGKARQIEVIEKMQEIVDEYTHAHESLTDALKDGPTYLYAFFEYQPIEEDVDQLADVIVQLKKELTKFLENSQDTWYKFSFKK